MVSQEGDNYYIQRRPELREGFERDAREWRPVLDQRYGDDLSETLLREARQHFELLIPEMPYIGGDENTLTGSLIGSARCLALYRALKARGKSAQETGKVLYDAIITHPEAHITQIPPSQRLSRAELMKLRRERAERSQQRRYAWDWVYEFVEGDNISFDYGYNFTECASHKFYLAQGAIEFLPYYCFLDFPKCELSGLGLSRSMTLGEGHELCNFRFREGGRATQRWPPPFLK